VSQSFGHVDLVSFREELVRPTVGGEIGATGRASGEMRLELGQRSGGQFAVEVFDKSLDRFFARHARVLGASLVGNGEGAKRFDYDCVNWRVSCSRSAMRARWSRDLTDATESLRTSATFSLVRPSPSRRTRMARYCAGSASRAPSSVRRVSPDSAARSGSCDQSATR